jgi:hypothetical protein
MRCRSDFAYEKPTEATLSGIHLEVSDADNSSGGMEQNQSLLVKEPSRPRRENLFGVTFTVNDNDEGACQVSAGHSQAT